MEIPPFVDVFPIDWKRWISIAMLVYQRVQVWILDAVFMYFLSPRFLFMELLLGSLQDLNLRTWFCKTCFFESSVFRKFRVSPTLWH